MSNLCSFTGYLTADANIRDEYVELNLADNPVGKAKDRYATIFVRATFKLPNPVAQIASEMKKGEFCTIGGPLQLRMYKDKQGKPGVSLEIPYPAQLARAPRPKADDAPDSDPNNGAETAGEGDAFPGA